MKKIGVMLDSIGSSQISECVIDTFNSISLSESDVDTIAFYKKHPTPPSTPLFSCMEQTELWGYEGDVIATSLDNAMTLTNITAPRRKFFYVWDLEWARLTNTRYSYLESIYNNESLELIARSDWHASLISQYWQSPIATIKDFNALDILSLCGEN